MLSADLEKLEISVEPIKGTRSYRIRADGYMIGTVTSRDGAHINLIQRFDQAVIAKIERMVRAQLTNKITGTTEAPEIPEEVLKPNRAIDDIDDFDA